MKALTYESSVSLVSALGAIFSNSPMNTKSASSCWLVLALHDNNYKDGIYACLVIISGWYHSCYFNIFESLERPTEQSIGRVIGENDENYCSLIIISGGNCAGVRVAACFWTCDAWNLIIHLSCRSTCVQQLKLQKRANQGLSVHSELRKVAEGCRLADGRRKQKTYLSWGLFVLALPPEAGR